MPSIHDIFDTNWLGPDHLNGKTVEVTIEIAKVEMIYNPRSGEKEKKLIVSFVGGRRKLILNKTQALEIASIHGDDYTSWGGSKIKLEPGIRNKNPTILIRNV